uniref:G_PROTEIN_RECEP_F3_4 domain-containing protein n=1 Tax=Rhabditophanes sp. KR3021 TaxID=114890 RepID=A0AC35U9C6_9BILA
MPIVLPIREVYIEGDIILGGLFPIHAAGRNGQSCGKIKADQGVQRMLAMIYALGEINKDQSILPGIRLGAQIFDTCSHDTYALEQSIVFIKSLLTSQTSGFYCTDYNQEKSHRPTVSAVIGAASSTVSLMVASMMQLFKIPVLSYSSTGVELSEKPRFEFFSRVVPPDNLQAKAMAFLVKKLGWNYVHAVADTGSYGERGMDVFRAAATELGICIDGEIHKISRRMSDEVFSEIIIRMKDSKKARGVVMFVDEDNLRRFLSILKRLSETKKHRALHNYFWFIASDSWGAKTSVIKGFEEIVRGAITIAPTVRTARGFDDYFKNLRHQNTFLTEYWDSLNCSQWQNKKLGDCYVNNNLTFKQEAYVPFVIDAVKTMALAMHNAIQEKCGSFYWKNCTLAKVGFDGADLQRRYRNKSIIPGEAPLIDAIGDGIGKYTIFQLNDKGNYKKVGNWHDGGNMELRVETVRKGLKLLESDPLPLSVCSEPCGKGFYKAYQDQTCCWTCIPCDASTSIIKNETICQECPLGQVPNEHQNYCKPITPLYMHWDTLWVFIPTCFSVIGIMVSLFVTSVFIRYHKTPVVMASGRELCYCMLCGIVLCYTVTFVLVSKPSYIICSASRILMGISMSFVYAAILVKTNRLARVFTLNGPVRPKCISPLAQVIICLAIVGAQLVGSIIWLIIDPAEVAIIYPSRTEAVLSCKATSSHLLISLTYNILLIIMCTIYAFKTRKIPENFNESRLIGFTMYSTSILWLSFGPIYFATQNNFRIQITSLCMCVSLSGTVALACFFFPKIYIVLWQPFKNVKSRQSAVGKLVNSQMRFISHLATTADQNGNIMIRDQPVSVSICSDNASTNVMSGVDKTVKSSLSPPSTHSTAVVQSAPAEANNQRNQNQNDLMMKVSNAADLQKTKIEEIVEEGTTTSARIFNDPFSDPLQVNSTNMQEPSPPSPNIHRNYGYENSDYDESLSEHLEPSQHRPPQMAMLRLRRRSSPSRFNFDNLPNDRQQHVQLILGKIKSDPRVTLL